MKTIVPFTKEVKLDTRVAEITSISLEHELDVEEDNLTGEFIISGDYKTHEISINRDAFTYRLPFHVELGGNVDRDSLDFEVLDFTYDLVDEDTLKLDIEFSVEASERTVEVEEDLEALNDKIDEFIEGEKELFEPAEEGRLDEESEMTILNTVVDKDDDFVTYNIHIVKESETIESICALYNADLDLVKHYNNIEEITSHDKLVIPVEFHEQNN